jgi:hypothetical protein
VVYLPLSGVSASVLAQLAASNIGAGCRSETLGSRINDVKSDPRNIFPFRPYIPVYAIFMHFLGALYAVNSPIVIGELVG